MKKNVCCCLVALLLFLVARPLQCPAEPAGEEVSGVKGTLQKSDGSPIQEAVVLFFDAAAGQPPVPEEYWRLPDEGGPVDEQGRFWVDLPPGIYWMGAIQMPEKVKNSQPKFEEWLYISRESNGELQTFSVKEGQTTDLGTLATGPLTPLRQDSKKAAILGGKILNQDGQPLAGLVVEAYKKNDDTGKPVFSSDQSTEQGQFLMKLPAGNFYLKIRGPLKMDPNSLQYQEQVKYKLPEATEITIVAGQKNQYQNFVVQTP